MTRAEKIPATIITGFLGAGKTTLIRHLLETVSDRQLALVINEFGDVGVDGDLLQSCGIKNCSSERIIELTNGCLCCTVADDFIPAIEKLLEHDKRPDHIIIETSGLALPKPLVKAFDWPAIRSKLTVDGVIAVIDGKAVVDGLLTTDATINKTDQASDAIVDHDNPIEEVFEDQLSCADIIILNKIDLMRAEEEQAVSDQISKTARSKARILKSVKGNIDPIVLLGLASGVENDLDNRYSHHDAEEEHDHDDFTSFVIELGDIEDIDGLTDKLSAIADTYGILRIKGFLNVRGRPARLLIQGVGSRFQHYFDRPWTTDETRTSRLVVIGLKGLDRDKITQSLTQL